MQVITRQAMAFGNGVELYDLFQQDARTVVGIGPYFSLAVPCPDLRVEHAGMAATVEVRSDRQPGYDFPRTFIYIARFPHDLVPDADGRVGVTVRSGDERRSVHVAASAEERRCTLATVSLDPPKLIQRWVEHHTETLGVDHAYIYCNTTDHLQRCVRELSGTAVAEKITLIDWNVPYWRPFEGHGAPGPSGQTTQQNHAIYHQHRAGLIGLLDVDEYVVPYCSDLVGYMLNMVGNAHFYQLRGQFYMQQLTIAAFSLQCQMFGCGRGVTFTEENFLERLVWRSAELCGKFSRQKCFVVPQRVSVFSVHQLVDGGTVFFIDPALARFNHYFHITKPGAACNCDVDCHEVDVDILKTRCR